MRVSLKVDSVLALAVANLILVGASLIAMSGLAGGAYAQASGASGAAATPALDASTQEQSALEAKAIEPKAREAHATQSDSTDGENASASNERMTELMSTVESESQEPAWIHRIRYSDTETATDYLVVEAGGHAKLMDCEDDFEHQLVSVARDYVDSVIGVDDSWKELGLSAAKLKPYLVTDHEYVKSRKNEFGSTFWKYGQLAFNEDFRNWVRREHREAAQHKRLRVWSIGAGGTLGLLALVAVVLKARGNCCR